MFIDPMRSIVLSKSYPENIWLWKCCACASSVSVVGWLSRMCSPAATKNPHVPLAGSQITSSGWGAVISTMSRMMWRGVRNWPFCPEVAILESMYSYTSPLVSRSSIGMASRPSTAFCNSAGVGIESRAPLMCSACVLCSARACRNGKTYSPTTSYISARCHVLEPRPAKVVMRTPPRLPIGMEPLPLREDGLVNRRPCAVRLVLRQRLPLVQRFDEQQVGELLHHLQRVRDSPRPEVIPHRVDAALQLPRDHHPPFQPKQRCRAPSPRIAPSLLREGVLVAVGVLTALITIF